MLICKCRSERIRFKKYKSRKRTIVTRTSRINYFSMLFWVRKKTCFWFLRQNSKSLGCRRRISYLYLIRTSRYSYFSMLFWGRKKTCFWFLRQNSKSLGCRRRISYLYLIRTSRWSYFSMLFWGRKKTCFWFF